MVKKKALKKKKEVNKLLMGRFNGKIFYSVVTYLLIKDYWYLSSHCKTINGYNLRSLKVQENVDLMQKGGDEYNWRT